MIMSSNRIISHNPSIFCSKKTKSKIGYATSRKMATIYALLTTGTPLIDLVYQNSSNESSFFFREGVYCLFYLCCISLFKWEVICSYHYDRGSLPRKGQSTPLLETASF